MNDVEFKNFKEDMDCWIKRINQRLNELEDLPSVVNENVDNTQHNYELIYELKDEIEELKQENNALKLIQMITLKNQNKLEKEKSMELHRC